MLIYRIETLLNCIQDYFYNNNDNNDFDNAKLF